MSRESRVKDLLGWQVRGEQLSKMACPIVCSTEVLTELWNDV